MYGRSIPCFHDGIIAQHVRMPEKRSNKTRLYRIAESHFTIWAKDVNQDTLETRTFTVRS
jgi:hypothetical protein